MRSDHPWLKLHKPRHKPGCHRIDHWAGNGDRQVSDLFLSCFSADSFVNFFYETMIEGVVKRLCTRSTQMHPSIPFCHDPDEPQAT
jgi:hypothetical protein